MKKLKSHFAFTKQEQRGIFFLLVFIVGIQSVFYLNKSSRGQSGEGVTLDVGIQFTIDSLKQAVLKNESVTRYPFNPNFISDYKGYVLGMSLAEIDRLHAYRAKDKFVNSAEEFQKVTLISDSLLEKLSRSFKFPDWTQNTNRLNPKIAVHKKKQPIDSKDIKIGVKDINKATAEELKTIHGIGDKLSARIIKFRNRLGGFVVDGQLNDVYGLEPEVVHRALKRFRVLQKPTINKININTASASEMAQLIYITYSIADQIVKYRENNGGFVSFDELTKIEDFPIEKINRIKLYLTL